MLGRIGPLGRRLRFPASRNRRRRQHRAGHDVSGGRRHRAGFPDRVERQSRHDECPLPCAPGQIDLSQPAFAKLAPLQTGRLPITWTLVSPASNDTISIRYKTGSSRWWCGIQVIGHRNPVALLKVRVGAAWRQLPRTDYNYFLAADGSGCGGSIRITDIYGQQLLINGIAVTPDVVQRTGVQFARH